MGLNKLSLGKKAQSRQVLSLTQNNTLIEQQQKHDHLPTIKQVKKFQNIGMRNH